MKSLLSLILRHGAEYLVALCLLLLHLAFISLPGRHAVLASSNLMTNLIRMEARQDIRPNSLVLAGSSITGRMMAEFFPPAVGPVNLGLDGCGSMEAAAAVVASRKYPQTLLLEANTVGPVYAKNFKTVLDAQSPVRQCAQQWLPFLAAEERPVDLAYNFLRSRKQPTETVSGRLLWNESATLPSLPAAEGEAMTDEASKTYFATARHTLAELKAHGVRMAFVVYPADREPQLEDRHAPAILRARTLAREFALPVFDLRQCDGQQQLTFTDYVHLSPAGARMVATLLEQEVLPRIK
jgi:hypothetical protein